MKSRAKFKVTSITEFEGGNRSVNLTPVSGGEENKAFWKYTPSGRLELGLSADCKVAFKPGQVYFLDFTPEAEE